MPLGRISCAVLLPVLLACAQPPQPLPAGISLTVRLETTLDSEHSEEDGRLRGLDRKPNQTAVGIQFTEMQIAGTKIRVVLELESIVSRLPGTPRQDAGAWDGRPSVRAVAPTMIVNEPRGTGIFVVPREQFKLPHLEMVWRTLSLEQC